MSKLINKLLYFVNGAAEQISTLDPLAVFQVTAVESKSIKATDANGLNPNTFDKSGLTLTDASGADAQALSQAVLKNLIVLQGAGSSRAATHAELQSEIDARIAQDTVHTNAINDEISRATGAESNLTGLINQEATDRAAADTQIRTDFAAVDTAIRGEFAAADTTLQQHIDAEATTRGNADTTLQQHIDSEATTRGNADTTLQQHIDSEASTRSAADSAMSAILSGSTTTVASYIAGFDGPGGQIAVSSTVLVGSAFNHAGTSPITTIKLEMLKVGAPSGNIKMSLYTEVAGVPSALVATSADVPVSAFADTNHHLISFNFSAVNPAAAKYWFVVSPSTGYTSDASNALKMQASSNSNAPYAAAYSTAGLAGPWTSYQKPNFEIISQTSGVVGDLAAETAARTAADSALNTAISNEVTRATGAEGTLNTAISNEVSRATAAEAALAAQIAAAPSALEWQDSVIDIRDQAPNYGSSDDGKRHLVGTVPQGAHFAGHANEIATYHYATDSWSFVVPKTGFMVSVDAEPDGVYYYSGSAWSKMLWESTTAAVGGGLSLSGRAMSIAAGGVATAMIANLAVDGSKIANSAVSAAKLANDSVTTAKILDGQVTVAKLDPAIVDNSTIEIKAGGSSVSVWLQQADESTDIFSIHPAGYTNTDGVMDVGLAFTAAAAHTLSSFVVAIQPASGGRGSLQFPSYSLYSISGSNPSLVANTTGYEDLGVSSGSVHHVRYSFATPVSLSAFNDYAILQSGGSDPVTFQGKAAAGDFSKTYYYDNMGMSGAGWYRDDNSDPYFQLEGDATSAVSALAVKDGAISHAKMAADAIKDVNVAADAAIQMSKIDGLVAALAASAHETSRLFDGQTFNSGYLMAYAPTIAYAQADSVANCRGLFGFVQETGTDSRVGTSGAFGFTFAAETGSPAIVSGDILYLSASEAGKVTKVPPSAIGSCVVEVGVAIAPTAMLFRHSFKYTNA